MEFEEFREICKLNGLEIDEAKARLLQSYVSLLIDWNRKINLISRKESDIWGRHILHSISPLFKIEIESSSLILDLGTGGGLPGIPWAILKQDSNFILLDGTLKKVEAVSDIIKKLGLENAKAVWGRAEEISKLNEYRNRFDYVICRAVGELKKVVKWSVKFLKPKIFPKKFLEKTESKFYLHSCSLIAFKGGDVEREINDAFKTSLVSEVDVVELNFLGFERINLEDKKVVLMKLTTKKV
ncbi:16S rRNA m(7)G-527 methyltransferase [Candidatus Kryptobacter tengchongensis]|nr:16S rRNA m(7)G-527 methyltransferase [Candidatus Kryptobacter tengchongensis]